nr:7beta2-HSDH [synthetic construct]
MTLREKYGEWGIILGATEGVGKAFCERLAKEGMNVVMVGRREEKLKELGEELKNTYEIDYKVVKADFSLPDATDKIFAATENLDMGFMAYVACLHSFGKIQDTPWEKHEAMINVNVVTFMKCFYHYMKIFAAQDRGAVINVSSMTGISSSPWNGQYGAGKAFILKMTEAVACETEKTNVDVEVITLGTTLTPSLLSNLPGGPQGEAVMKTAQTPEEVVDEAFEKLGKELSVISGERNKASVHDWKANHTEDDYIRYMGSFYQEGGGGSGGGGSGGGGSGVKESLV